MHIRIDGHHTEMSINEVRTLIFARDSHACRFCGYKDPLDYYERQTGPKRRKSGLVLDHRRYAKDYSAWIGKDGKLEVEKGNRLDPYTLEDFLTLCITCNIRNRIRTGGEVKEGR